MKYAGALEQALKGAGMSMSSVVACVQEGDAALARA